MVLRSCIQGIHRPKVKHNRNIYFIIYVVFFIILHGKVILNLIFLSYFMRENNPSFLFDLTSAHIISAMCPSNWANMRLYLFVWPKSLLIVNYIIKSLYSMVKINLEYFHCITYDSIFVVWWLFKNLMEWPRDCCVYIREYSSNRNRTSRCFLLLAFSSIS